MVNSDIDKQIVRSYKKIEKEFMKCFFNLNNRNKPLMFN